MQPPVSASDRDKPSGKHNSLCPASNRFRRARPGGAINWQYKWLNWNYEAGPEELLTISTFYSRIFGPPPPRRNRAAQYGLAMSTVWKQKPTSSRFATTLLVARHSVILAARQTRLQNFDSNFLCGHEADQYDQISSMSPFCDLQDLTGCCGHCRRSAGC